jgi:AAA+ superfamily predicted ATPase
VPPDPELLSALEAALHQSPDQVTLRLHLGSLYAEAGRWSESLQHAEAVLGRHPADQAALALAAAACEATGLSERATGYRRLLAALGAVPGLDAAPPVGPAAVPPAAGSATAFPAPPLPPAPGGTPPGSIGHPDHPSNPASGSSFTGDGLPAGMQPLAAGDGPAFDEAAMDAFLEDVLGEAAEKRTTLADVAGLDAVKKRLQASFLGPMQNPELRRMYGKSLRGGLLLYGPPGCGKTYLARAVAGELGARFIAVGLHDVLDMWLGKSEQNLHGLFESARRYTPSVLFLDEVDALGMKRSNLSHSAGRNVVVQLLSEMDGARTENEGVFVLGATNQPWDIDPALRRPGRFDRMLLVLPPDRPAREAILALNLKDRPVDPNVKLGSLAERTEGFSGADLRLLCEGAAEMALEDSLASGTARAINMRDLERELKQIQPSTRPWFETARNYALFANDGGAYDDLLAYMRKHKLA